MSAKASPEMQGKALARLRALQDGAPRLYSRWSDRAWRLLCEGPALRLWDSIAETPGAEQTLEDYLLLAREAVGLQYVNASEPADLTPGIGRSFLAEALTDAAPRLLAAVEPKDRARSLTQLWNVGERLIDKPLWLNRYLAARLHELERLDHFEEFLAVVIGEGLDEGPRSSWKGPYATSIVDPSIADFGFLPGVMHLATPAIVCCHDRRKKDRHVALLFRSTKSGGPVCLGATPCLQEAGGAVAHKLSMKEEAAVVQASGLGDATEILASRTGFAAITCEMSQRVRIVESAA